MAGKLPLCLKALEAGISASELVIDVAQAGGMCGENDGMLQAMNGTLEPLEIKVFLLHSSSFQHLTDSFVFYREPVPKKIGLALLSSRTFGEHHIVVTDLESLDQRNR